MGREEGGEEADPAGCNRRERPVGHGRPEPRHKPKRPTGGEGAPDADQVDGPIGAATAIPSAMLARTGASSIRSILLRPAAPHATRRVTLSASGGCYDGRQP